MTNGEIAKEPEMGEEPERKPSKKENKQQTIEDLEKELDE